MKQALKRLVFGTRRIPQWCAVGIEDPSRLFRLSLEDEGLCVDVTEASSVASLRPVTFAIRTGGGAGGHDFGKGGAVLRVRPRAGEDCIGEISLRFVRDVGTDAARISLFTVTGHRNRSLPRADDLRFRLRQRWEIFRDKTPYNFRMVPAELFALYLFYYVPRPVSLVSVAFEGASNIFPMDLVGRMGDDLFLLALRSTSPAIRLMSGSRRLALAAAPFEEKDVVYRLGTHHKKETIDWDALPFPGVPSPLFGLRVPASALGVREVEVLATEPVGTHVLFITRIVGEERWRPGRQLCHIPGVLREVLTRVSPSTAAGHGIEGLS
jgi:flavin reductase (DIM6/NTAB) family NADH-FMN oxidoreductase RutF